MPDVFDQAAGDVFDQAAVNMPANQPHWYTGVGDTLARQVSSMGESIAGMPGSLYHAVADPTTPEEMEESHGLDVFPGVTSISRLTAKPLKTAIDWYKGAASGEVPNAYEQALDVAPEAMGQGEGAVLAPKLLESVPGAIRGTVKAARNFEAPNLAAKVKALSKTGGQDLFSRVPVAGRLVRRPSVGDYVNAARAKAPTAPPGEVLPPSTDQVPGRPYQPDPHYQAQPASAEPIPARSGLALPPGPPEAIPAPQPTPIGDLLNESLGGKALRPDVPLKDQMSAPSGFTPVKSSAIRSYRYDPIAREMTTVTRNGDTYVHGDVAPEQVDAFEAASSKGQAWSELKRNSPLVAKIVNGKRIATKPGGPRSFSPTDEPPSSNENLTPILRESLKQAMKARK